MAAPYIPPSDAALLAFALNYQSLTTASPGTYGLSAPDAATISTAVTTYQAAQALVDSPDTKTVTTVAAKNSAKQTLISILRAYSSQIRLNAGVTNAAKLALGLNLPNNSPVPVPVPSSIPIISIIGAQPLQFTIRYADATTPSLRAKPFGSIAIELWVSTGVVVGTDPMLAQKAASVTKQPFGLDFDVSQTGKIATIWGRWITRSGLVGGWSSSVSMLVPGT